MITVQIPSLLVQRAKRVSLCTEEITVQGAARNGQVIHQKNPSNCFRVKG